MTFKETWSYYVLLAQKPELSSGGLVVNTIVHFEQLTKKCSIWLGDALTLPQSKN